MATVLSRTGLSIPDVGETGWGTATNLSFTTFDTNVAMQNKTNTFTQQMDIEAVTIFKNNVALQWKDSGGTGRNILRLDGSDDVLIQGVALGGEVKIQPLGTDQPARVQATQSGSSSTPMLIVEQDTGGSHTRPHFRLVALSADPGSPTNGDFWFSGTALKVRISGVTKTVTVT